MKASLYEYLQEECNAMVKHLSAHGKEIPLEASILLRQCSDESNSSEIPEAAILKLHRILSRKIAPAHPLTVTLLCKEMNKNIFLRFLGPVSLVRRLMLTAILSLVLFVVISISKYITPKIIEENIYNMQGTVVLMILLYYLSSASLGATFSNLFHVNKYISNSTFDPKYESSYWIRLVLGVMAGLMIAVVIPIPSVDDGMGNEMKQLVHSSRPLLAMLGGFSSSLVYKILSRLIFAVESIFTGKQDSFDEKQFAQLETVRDLENQIKQQHMEKVLSELQVQIKLGSKRDEMGKNVQKLINDISN